MCLILRRIYHGSTKRRTSKTRKTNVVLTSKISVPGMTECPSCGEYKLSHRVCKNCGSYNGEEVVSK